MSSLATGEETVFTVRVECRDLLIANPAHEFGILNLIQEAVFSGVQVQVAEPVRSTRTDNMEEIGYFVDTYIVTLTGGATNLTTTTVTEYIDRIYTLVNNDRGYPVQRKVVWDTAQMAATVELYVNYEDEQDWIWSHHQMLEEEEDSNEESDWGSEDESIYRTRPFDGRTTEGLIF